MGTVGNLTSAWANALQAIYKTISGRSVEISGEIRTTMSTFTKATIGTFLSMQMRINYTLFELHYLCLRQRLLLFQPRSKLNSIIIYCKIFILSNTFRHKSWIRPSLTRGSRRAVKACLFSVKRFLQSKEKLNLTIFLSL